MTTNQPLPHPHTPAPRHSPSRRAVSAGAIAATLVAAVVVAGVTVSGARSTVLAGRGSAALVPPAGQQPGAHPGRLRRRVLGDGTASSAALATASQQVGIVDVVSVFTYQQALGAGTGIVLTSNGEILTNNHVVDGATSIKVTVASTGVSYRAAVVGTDPSDDVAVLQLKHASGLEVANLGNSSAVVVGADVTGVGNAGGSGILTAVRGSVLALGRPITASDANGSNAERLTGLIETNAAVVPGDSGGPLYSAAGAIIGMDTAASTGTATSHAYAIPIDTALSIAKRIEGGIQTATIHIGYPGFLGVTVADAAIGARVTGVLGGGPAASAGIRAGDVITNVDGAAVTSASRLHDLLIGTDPGQRVSVAWTGAAGANREATVRLATGPAD